MHAPDQLQATLVFHETITTKLWFCRGSAGSVNENLNRLEEVWMPLPKNIQPNQWKGTQCTQAFESSSPQLRIHCYKTAAPLFRNGTVEHVALFHYATKSAEDFKNKMARGSGMSLRAKGYDYFNEILKCAPATCSCASGLIFEIVKLLHCFHTFARELVEFSVFDCLLHDLLVHKAYWYTNLYSATSPPPPALKVPLCLQKANKGPTLQGAKQAL